MKKLLLAISLVAIMAAPAFANYNHNLGCGVGTLVFESTMKSGTNGWLIQTLANFTNASLSGQFSITTGTVGCIGNINHVVSAEVYEFVNTNMDSLAKDIAQGNGETLSTLASMLEVADVDAYSSTLQANFAYIFPTADVQSADVANKVVELL